MTPELLDLKHRTKEAIKGVGGLEAAAGFCRLGKSRLGECQNENKAEDFLPIDVLIALERLTAERSGSPHILRGLCHQMGGVFVKLPQVDAAGANLMKLLARKVQEGADVSVALCEALEDGVVQPAEARKVRGEIMQLMELLAAMNAELAAIEGVEA